MTPDLGSVVIGAIVGAAITQLLNGWLLWGKIKDMNARLKAIEKQLDAIGHFQLNGGAP